MPILSGPRRVRRDGVPEPIEGGAHRPGGHRLGVVQRPHLRDLHYAAESRGGGACLRGRRRDRGHVSQSEALLRPRAQGAAGRGRVASPNHPEGDQRNGPRLSPPPIHPSRD